MKKEPLNASQVYGLLPLDLKGVDETGKSRESIILILVV